MPGAVGKDSKMEKKQKSKRKRVAATAHDSKTTVAVEVFTLDKAYAKYQLSTLNGKIPTKVEAAIVRDEAIVRDGSANAAHLLHVESSSSFVVRNHNAPLSSTEKGAGRWQQESCITEDGSGSDNSEGVESLEQRGASGDGLAQSVSQSEAAKEKAKRKRVDDVENGEGSEVHSPSKTQKLSEEARVWQYVCKRSVFVSPPQRAQLLDKKDSLVHLGTQPFRSIPSQFGPKGVQNYAFKDKTSSMDVVVNDKAIKVTLTKESSVAQEWIEQQTGKCFGLDLEWQPNRRKGRPDNKVALLQISSDTECLLIQMLFLDSIPSALVQFLKDPERKIVGVGIHGDTKKLHRDFGLICAGEVELTTLAVAHFKNEGLKRVGLKVLARHVLSFEMNKSKTVTMSNWSKSHLDKRQVEYACIDAWISHAIFGSLQKSSVIAT